VTERRESNPSAPTLTIPAVTISPPPHAGRDRAVDEVDGILPEGTGCGRPPASPLLFPDARHASVM